MSEKKRWRSVFGPDEVIQRVRPRESDAWLANPHRGTATFQRFNGDPLYPGLAWDDSAGPTDFQPFDGDPRDLRNDRYPRTTVAYCRWLWSVIEPERGRYRWDIMDGALEAARVRGQTLQARIQPYIGDDVPAWYWETGAGDYHTGVRRHIDHNDPLYLEHWGRFVRAFGDRYDGHHDLESFDVAYGGPCGETGGNTADETAERLVDVYLESFRKTQLVSMLGTHGCRYAADKRDGKIGWRADCYGDVHEDGKGVVPDRLCWNHMHDAYPKEVAQNGVEDTWRRAPVTLETCWTVGHWFKQGWDIDWIIEQGLKYHPTVFMPKSSYIPDEWKEKIDAFDGRLGYRFVLRQMTLPLEARPLESMRIQVWIDNVGVAPLYRPYRLAFRFRQGENSKLVMSGADITAWMPGHTWFQEKIVFPEGLEKGEANFDVGIVSDAEDGETGKPRVTFAIEEVSRDGWHPLTSIDVV